MSNRRFAAEAEPDFRRARGGPPGRTRGCLYVAMAAENRAPRAGPGRAGQRCCATSSGYWPVSRLRVSGCTSPARPKPVAAPSPGRHGRARARPPSLALFVTEPARGVADLATLQLARPWARAWPPRGDGHGVLVLPRADGRRRQHPAPARLLTCPASATTPGAGGWGATIWPTEEVVVGRARRAGLARRAGPAAGVPRGLEPGRDLRQGAGAATTPSWSAR